jgi:hypothetical protein
MNFYVVCLRRLIFSSIEIYSGWQLHFIGQHAEKEKSLPFIAFRKGLQQEVR